MPFNPADDAARLIERNREIAAEQAREKATGTTFIQPSPTPVWGNRNWHDHDRINQQGNQAMAMINLSNVISTLQAAGITGTSLATAVSTLAANSPTAAVQGICTVILSNSGNPSVIKDECIKLAEVPNLPVAVANLIPELAAATGPLQVVQVVQAIEAAIGAGNNAFSGFHLGF